MEKDSQDIRVKKEDVLEALEVDEVQDSSDLKGGEEEEKQADSKVDDVLMKSTALVVVKTKRGSKFILRSGLAIAVLLAVMPLIGELGSTNPKTTGTFGLWLNFLGGFHPVFLHLPIGALALVILMEVFGIFSKKNRVNMTLALAFCAGCSVLATIFGYFLYLGGEYQSDLMEEHKRDGIIFTILLILTFLLRYWMQYSDKKWIKCSYPVMLFLSGGMMMSAGHHGGQVTHGDPLDALPSKIQAARDEKATISDPVVYAEIVHPIIEEKCVSCHGPDKNKGELRMDSIAHMLSGGDAEECLVKGDVKASYMITSMELPVGDEYRMPPEDKPQITPNELKVLKWWVEIGAPETEKLSEVEASDEIKAAIQAITVGE